MKNYDNYIIIFPLTLLLILGFFTGKYKQLESDHPEKTRQGSFLKEWQMIGLLALIVILGILFRNVKGHYYQS